MSIFGEQIFEVEIIWKDWGRINVLVGDKVWEQLNNK